MKSIFKDTSSLPKEDRISYYDTIYRRSKYTSWILYAVLACIFTWVPFEISKIIMIPLGIIMVYFNTYRTPTALKKKYEVQMGG